jgi:hypothetical protein
MRPRAPQVACSKVAGQEQRARLQRVAGRRLLEALAPEALAQVSGGPNLGLRVHVTCRC